VGVEDVDVVQTEPVERRIEARQEVGPATELAIGPRPHVPARLGGDDQFVAIGLEVPAQHPAEVLLGRAIRWAVVVGEVEVRDPAIERVPQHFSLPVEGAVVAEVVPETERYRRKQEPGRPDPSVGHRVIAFSRRYPGVVGEGDVGDREFVGHHPIVGTVTHR
jgi:hypothetical protein